MGLSGRVIDVSIGVTTCIDDGGRVNRVNLWSSLLALAIIGCSMSLLCKEIRGMALVIPWWVPEMGIVSRPVFRNSERDSNCLESNMDVRGYRTSN